MDGNTFLFPFSRCSGLQATDGGDGGPIPLRHINESPCYEYMDNGTANGGSQFEVLLVNIPVPLVAQFGRAWPVLCPTADGFPISHYSCTSAKNLF